MFFGFLLGFMLAVGAVGSVMRAVTSRNGVVIMAQTLWTVGYIVLLVHYWNHA